MIDKIHFSYQKNPSDVYAVCGAQIGPIFRSSHLTTVANCPCCYSVLVEFMRDTSEYEADFNGDDSFALERLAEKAQKLMGVVQQSDQL